jgi:hypothetical protein
MSPGHVDVRFDESGFQELLPKLRGMELPHHAVHKQIDVAPFDHDDSRNFPDAARR